MDNNNLFSSMFGVESEETPVSEVPKTEPVQQTPETIPPTPTVQQQINIPPIQPQLAPVQPKQDEIVYLDSNTISRPEVQQPTPEPEKTQEQPLFDTYGMFEQKKVSLPTFEEPEKPSPAIIIFLIVALVGGGMFMLFTTFLDSAPTKTQIQEEESNQSTTTIIEKEDDDNGKVTPTVNSFDLTFTFNKGYTTNKKELYQTAPYEPEYTEGVIKCEHINDISISGMINKQSIYLYYKDNATKKLILTSESKFSNQSNFNSFVDSVKIMKDSSEEYDNLIFDYKTSTNSLTATLNMYVDLVYGSNFKFAGVETLIYTKVSYNTPIKSAMSKLLMDQENIGNMKCSTLITS